MLGFVIGVAPRINSPAKASSRQIGLAEKGRDVASEAASARLQATSRAEPLAPLFFRQNRRMISPPQSAMVDTAPWGLFDGPLDRPSVAISAAP